jgi:hypothetical protein
MNKVASALIALVLAWAGTTNAQFVIYDNGATLQGGVASDPDLQRFVASDFVLAPGANVITDIHWTGLYGGTTAIADNFTIQFFADVGGSPAIAPFVSLPIADPGRTEMAPFFSYSVDVAPIPLAPNTPFWLSIFNDTPGGIEDSWFWGAEFSPDPDNSVVRTDQTSMWSPLEFDARLDFQLTGVPLPAALPLLVVGLLTLFGLSWRRNQAV